MTRLTAVLAEHLDQPSQRHRLTAVDPRRLRCHDCDRTILLTQPSQITSTSHSPIPGPGEPRCPQHQHEHADGCRTCAADLKGRPDDAPQPQDQPTADVEARAAEARALLRTTTTTGSGVIKPQVRPYDDPERMAEVRAELAGRQPIPTPADTPDSSRP